MTDTIGADLEPVVNEQVEAGEVEDLEIDTLDAAVEAFDDDDKPEDEQTPEDDPEADAAEEEAEGEESDAGDAIVELPDGTSLSLSEIANLQADGLREADYTRKTTELSENRKAVEAQGKQYQERLQYAETTLQNVAGFVQGLIPPEPPIHLASTDPGAYTHQKALRDAAINELNTLTKIGQDVQQRKAGMSEEDQTAYKEKEAAALVKAMPHLADPAKRSAFEKANAETAKDFGFTPEEFASTADHRITQLVHYARLGKRSETNRNNAKRRVQTPQKGKAQVKQVPAQAASNTEAMQRLSKSGSLDDAMDIDFD